MDLIFWQKVQSNWQSVQADAIESTVNMDMFRSVLLEDIAKVKNSESYERKLEIHNEDDFWGDL
ncbi:hypothetical protein [Alteribacter aurantiacus]|uniref:hypothetical protein n=1 Tax=Alteribacter aurantiacus TaxID=254410 RepID=UPI00040C66D3|nr:hypothetical protein [Alteribacter aurantiacus]